MYSERLRQLEGALSYPTEHAKSSGPGDTTTEEEHDNSAVEDTGVSSALTYEFAGLGIGFASMLADTLLSHPFIVIRGQCQVMTTGSYIHISPFSLVPIVSKCVRSQGPAFLWKGLSSVFVVRGLCLLSDNVISELTSLPREVSKLSSLRRLGAHILLRTLSWVLVAPFYAASIVEIVQSEKASDPTTLVSCLRDGFCRLFHMPTAPRSGTQGQVFRSGVPIRSHPIATSRLLPIWRLIPPVVLLNVGHYIIRSVACVLATAYWSDGEDQLERDAELDFTLKTGGVYHTRQRTASQSRPTAHDSYSSNRPRDLPAADYLVLTQQRQETALQSKYARYYTDLMSAMTANLVADVLLYPLETLVIRLCVQGTRTLVDNMDTGEVVVPIVSAYDGLTDALRSAIDSPIGLLGLYRGFGAVIAQYALQCAFLCGIRRLYQQLLYLWPPALPIEAKLGTGPPHDSTTCDIQSYDSTPPR